MDRVYSKDGTAIAFDKSGTGPAIILVGGALSDRTAALPLAALLSPHFTVIGFDRRGRGDSGDTAPYSVEREVQDIQALIDEAGGSAFVFGISSGAVLALEAAAHGLAIKKLALYEPPFIVDDSRKPVAENYIDQITRLVAAGRRGDAVEFFLTGPVDIPSAMVAQMRNDPIWGVMEKLAHTLPYDAAVMGDAMSGKPLPAERWRSAAMPILVMDGGASPPWMRQSAQALAEVLFNAKYRTLEGQTHRVDFQVLVPVLSEFFQGE